MIIITILYYDYHYKTIYSYLSLFATAPTATIMIALLYYTTIITVYDNY